MFSMSDDNAIALFEWGCETWDNYYATGDEEWVTLERSLRTAWDMFAITKS